MSEEMIHNYYWNLYVNSLLGFRTFHSTDYDDCICKYFVFDNERND